MGIPFILSVARDISERKRIEKERAKFIEMTSHELRTPLTAIKGFTEVLREKLETLDMDQREVCFNAILNNIARLIGLVDGVIEV